ncbi:MAG: hypothetical protein Q8J65_08160 [Nitrosomonadales bacterium]|nr:hypothetical protein [Nitrosomonadales bacterium]
MATTNNAAARPFGLIQLLQLLMNGDLGSTKHEYKPLPYYYVLIYTPLYGNA